MKTRIDLGTSNEAPFNHPKCRCGWKVPYIHIPPEWAPIENPSILIECAGCHEVEFELLVVS